MLPRKTFLNQGLLLGWSKPTGKSRLPEGLWTDTGEGHHLTVAPTGAGKGVSSIIPALLTWPGPAIVIDPKGENYAVTAAHRRAMGQTVYVLDPFRITRAPDFDSLNPLDLVGEFNADDDAAMLASLVVSEGSFGTEPYWDERASALIQKAILHAITHGPRTDLGAVRDIVDGYSSGAFATARNVHTGEMNADAFMPSGMASDRTRSCIASTACSHMAFVLQGPVEKSLSISTVPLEDIRDGLPLTLYIVLPPERLRSHAKLLRLWLGVLLNTFAQRRVIPAIPTLMLVDEAAQLGELDGLRSALTLMRGYGVKLWTFWQDLSQIRKVYPKDWENVLTNSPFQQIFGVTNPHVMAQMSAYLGPILNQPLSALAPNEAVIICPNRPPEFAVRVDYRTDRMFTGLFSPNPFHATPRPAPKRRASVLPFQKSGEDRS